MAFRTAIAVAAGLGLTGAVTADDPEAHELFDLAREALLQAKSIVLTAKGSSEGTLMLGMELPEPESRVWMLRDDEAIGGWLLRWEGATTIKEPDGERRIEWLVVSDGRTTNWIDHEQKKVFSRPVTRARGEGVTLANASWIEELARVQPFTRKLQDVEDVVFEGLEFVDGVACKVARLRFASGAEERWFFSVEDHLPRRLEQILSGGGVELRSIKTLRDIAINEPIERSFFSIPCPEGYDCERDRLVTRPRPEPAPGGAFGAEHRTLTRVGLEPGNTAPDFELPRPDGSLFRLSELRGSAVVLAFWGDWVIGRDRFTPEIEALHRDYADRPVNVVGLTANSKPEDVAAYMQQHGLTFDNIPNAEDIVRQYNVSRFPMFFVIGRSGEVLYSSRTYKLAETFPEIRAALDAHLAATDDGDN